jgi:hypothetical protein
MTEVWFVGLLLTMIVILGVWFVKSKDTKGN